MANYKRQEPIFTKSYKIRTSFTPNLNRNPINSVRPSVDYSDVDFDSIAVQPQKKDEEDTVKPINHGKRRPVFDRLGDMPTKSLSQRIGLTTTNQPITDVQEVSNDLQDNDITIKTRSESNVALEATKTNHKIDNKIKPQQKDEEDTVNPINDAKRRPVFDRLGDMPTKTLNQRIGLTTTNQSITDVQEISNDLQDKDINIKIRSESNVTPITTKRNHTIDNKIIHLDVPTEKLPSRKRKNTSRPHSTESKNRKKIRISNIKKHGESNNKYRHNAHDHNDISIDTQLIGRTRTPERSRSQKNSS